MTSKTYVLLFPPYVVNNAARVGKRKDGLERMSQERESVGALAVYRQIVIQSSEGKGIEGTVFGSFCHLKRVYEN